jgi:hypothetical protein
MHGLLLVELSVGRHTSNYFIDFTDLSSQAAYMHACLMILTSHLTFLKRLLREILAYFRWPVYTDSYCSLD